MGVRVDDGGDGDSGDGDSGDGDSGGSAAAGSSSAQPVDLGCIGVAYQTRSRLLVVSGDQRQYARSIKHQKFVARFKALALIRLGDRFLVTCHEAMQRVSRWLVGGVLGAVAYLRFAALSAVRAVPSHHRQRAQVAERRRRQGGGRHRREHAQQ
jgi:hypothetical protein